jgi:hypothetical protein
MSSQLTQRDSPDTESELALQEPPPWVIRWTAWLLFAAFLFTLLIAIVMRLPETVDCRFVLIPATGADPIQSPRQAIIISPSAVTTTEGSRFVALGSLDSYEISSRIGQALSLRVGMKGDAHIIVGGRTLIEYAFEPIRQLRESMKQ